MWYMLILNLICKKTIMLTSRPLYILLPASWSKTWNATNFGNLDWHILYLLYAVSWMHLATLACNMGFCLILFTRLMICHFRQEGQKERMWGMTGRESNPASLFQLFVNCGRYAEATYLLLEYIESFASMVNYLLLWIEFITVIIRIG
jgi:hypothetical protein